MTVMKSLIDKNADEKTIPIIPVTQEEFSNKRLYQEIPLGLTDFVRNFLAFNKFKAQPGKHICVPNSHGNLNAVFIGVKDHSDIWGLAGLPQALDASYTYEIKRSLGKDQSNALALGWALGAYQYQGYKNRPQNDQSPACLVWPPRSEKKAIEIEVSALYKIRDLIHRSANDLTPAKLESEAIGLCKNFNARSKVTRAKTLEEDYPLISLVGQAGKEKGRLVDFSWGDADAPKITLIGKGVTYDTGGLNVKTAKGMVDMHVDMSGAAQVLGLAQMIMESNLPVRLRVMIPIVENAVNENSMRAGDIVYSPLLKQTVHIGHTDAEGRVILAEPLREAAEETPDLLIDMATLTGASRRALGSLPALFSNNQDLAQGLVKVSRTARDVLWQLPLIEVQEQFDQAIDHERSDVTSDPDNGNPDHINAALWLKRAVGNDNVPWAHIDFGVLGPNLPGRPGTGCEKGVRALWSYLKQTYPSP